MNADDDHRTAPGSGDLRSFGRRRGRKLSPRQQGLLDELLPRVGLDLAKPAPVPLGKLFGVGPCGSEPMRETPSHGMVSGPQGTPEPPMPLRDVWLEIGFGGAEHLIWQATHNPGVGIIGCEPFEEGVVKALTAIEDHDLRNVRIHPDDARAVLRWLPSASISRAFILFPDPWPKRKHAKRRLVNGTTLDLLARVLRPGAELRIATDIGDYIRTSMIALQRHPAFAWQARSPADWRARPPDWPQTRYEQKAHREGRRGYFFSFLRTDSAGGPNL